MFNLKPQYNMKKSTVYIILLHLSYWGYIVNRLYVSYNPQANVDYQKLYFNSVVAVAFGFIGFYIVYGYIFPYFIQKSKPVTPGTSIILLFIILLFLVGLPCLQVYFDLYKQEKYRLMMPNLLFALFSFSITALLLKGFTTWVLEIEYKKQLEKNNLESNLALIKARINPHFLFNTLNNIDVLIEKDPTTASTYLKKLSDILRFTLHEAPSDSIALNKEINHIEQYIELQKIRSSNINFVKFDAGAATHNLQISPMLFMPFIENAFKYSTNKKIDNAITITLKTQANQVIFSCVNIYDDKQPITTEDGGLGLELIKNRLELLYPKNYKLDTAKTADHFTVNLVVTLV
jgi:two-component system LytT family sensor kinase